MDQTNNEADPYQASYQPTPAVTKAKSVFLKKILLPILILVLLILSGLGFFGYQLYSQRAPEVSYFTPNTAYEGTWATGNPGGLYSKLTIISVNGNKALVNYQWGLGAGSGSEQIKAIIKPNGDLTWGGKHSPLFIFTPMGSNIIKGTRAVDDTLLEVTLEKSSN